MIDTIAWQTTLRWSAWCLLAVSAVVPCRSARAELPPGSYDDLRAKAQESLTIKVLWVRTAKLPAGATDVEVRAEVVGAKQSKLGFKKGDVFVIRYSIDDPNVSRPGPMPVPLLKKQQVCPAFLNPAKTRVGSFEPAAYGMSFDSRPESEITTGR